MELLAVSISHENTPISIREKVSFTKKKQAEILKYIKQNIDVYKRQVPPSCTKAFSTPISTAKSSTSSYSLSVTFLFISGYFKTLSSGVY